MSEALFFADIDPNQDGQAIPAKQVRRLLLSRLLVWDNIVVSDSQMLQDPRFRVMMEPSVAQGLRMPNRSEDKRFDDLEDWQRGFEGLLSSGLIEVARRKESDGTASLVKTWSNMSKSEHKVPFLPESVSYAKYIEHIGYTARDYCLSRVADRFSKNLREGIAKKAVPLNDSNPAHRELVDLMNADRVQLRDILALLNEQLHAEAITPEERDLLYQYSFRCYSVNVPAETGCYISAKLRQIPLFLQSGTYDGVDGTALIDQSRMRRSWAIDPVALDLLPIEAFIDLRRALHDEFATGLLLKQREGNVQSEDEAKSFYDVWESYTKKLEREMRHALRVKRDKLNEITTKDYVSAQVHLENQATEFIANHVVSHIPVVSEIKSLVDMYRDVKELKDSLIVFNQKQAQAYFVEHHDKIQKYLDSLCDGDVSIVTKY